MKTNIHPASLHPFLLLWASQSISSMGTAMTNYALTIWVHSQSGDASSLTLLTLCSFLPTILFRFLAGAMADRWDKKRIMLISDFIAACGTVLVFALYSASALLVVHLYAINFLLSLMNAFQQPAAYVATSLLVPKEHYARADGLKATSKALSSILSPVLGAVVLGWGGLSAVLMVDLITFAIAFAALLLIPIPRIEKAQETSRDPFWKSCLAGIRYLKGCPSILRMIVFIAAVNFLAKLGPDGLMAVFILNRTGGSQSTLSVVQSAVALGLLAGGTLAAMVKPPKNSIRAICLLCSLIFLSGVGLSLSRSMLGWCIAAFIQYLYAAVMNVHWNAFMRAAVPLPMQGRVFSARDTLQNCTIPLGLYLGGLLADQVFEPLMASDSVIQQLLAPLFGAGSGAGVAVQFFLTALIGLALSIVCMLGKGTQQHS